MADEATLAPDYYARSLDYARKNVSDPRLHERLSQLLLHLVAVGTRTDDPGIHKYVQAVLCRTPEQREALRQGLRLPNQSGGSPAWSEPVRSERPAVALILERTAARAGIDRWTLLMLAELAAAFVLIWIGAFESGTPAKVSTTQWIERISGRIRQVVDNFSPPPPLESVLSNWPNLYGWLVIASVVLGLLAAYWWHRRRKRRIRQGGNPDTRPLAEVAVNRGRGALFEAAEMRNVLRHLRRHRATPSAQLDLRGTIRATVARAGLISLRFRTRPVSPEYLILSEREMQGDHLPEVGAALSRKLEAAQIGYAHYEFFGSPHRLRRVDGKQAHQFEPADAVLARHNGARMLVLMESYDVRRRDGGTPRWLTDLLADTGPVLFNPRERKHFQHEHESRLDENGLLSVPATVAGLFGYAHRMAGIGGEPVLIREPHEPDLPGFLSDQRIAMLSPHSPDEVHVENLLHNLHQWLGPEGLEWLRTIALFPLISTGYTFFSGNVAGDWFSHERFLRIARLPWLRAGVMPEWLRAALVRGFQPLQLERARAIGQAYLIWRQGDDVDRAALLKLGEDKKARKTLIERLAQSENPLLRDSFLIDALAGRKAHELGIVGKQEETAWWNVAWRRAGEIGLDRALTVLVPFLLGTVMFLGPLRENLLKFEERLPEGTGLQPSDAASPMNPTSEGPNSVASEFARQNTPHLAPASRDGGQGQLDGERGALPTSDTWRSATTGSSQFDCSYGDPQEIQREIIANAKQTRAELKAGIISNVSVRLEASVYVDRNTSTSNLTSQCANEAERNIRSILPNVPIAVSVRPEGGDYPNYLTVYFEHARLKDASSSAVGANQELWSVAQVVESPLESEPCTTSNGREDNCLTNTSSRVPLIWAQSTTRSDKYDCNTSGSLNDQNSLKQRRSVLSFANDLIRNYKVGYIKNMSINIYINQASDDGLFENDCYSFRTELRSIFKSSAVAIEDYEDKDSPIPPFLQVEATYLEKKYNTNESISPPVDTVRQPREVTPIPSRQPRSRKGLDQGPPPN